MNKIKDIIYDKSDILIAILILALAAIVILWRLGIILEYPKEIIGTDDPTNILTEPTEEGESGEAEETGDQGEAGETGENENGESTETGENGEAGETGENETGDQGEAGENGESEETVTTTAQWDGNKLAKDLEVTITGTTATAAVQCLVDAGVYEDYADYKKVCEENGWNHEKMKAGVFTFEKGTTKKEITRAVNWS